MGTFGCYYSRPHFTNPCSTPVPKSGESLRKDCAEILREHYSRWVAIPASLILIVANIALIAADLVAIGSGLELITGLSWVWFVIPVGVILWYLTVYRNFETIKKIFIVMSLAFVAYIITAIFSHPNWGEVLINTFVPHLDFSFVTISSCRSLAWSNDFSLQYVLAGAGRKRGATRGINQTKDARRCPGHRYRRNQRQSHRVLHHHFYCIDACSCIIRTSPLLLMQHVRLEPLLGPFAKYLFAIGLIGAGLIAIPVLLASTSYAVAGTFGWPTGLSKKPWQTEGFYLILTGALLVSLALALLRLDPIKLIFWANVLSGVLAPILVVYLVVIGNNRKIMQKQRLGLITNIGLVLTALVMFSAAILLFYGLATGKGG